MCVGVELVCMCAKNLECKVFDSYRTDHRCLMRGNIISLILFDSVIVQLTIKTTE